MKPSEVYALFGDVSRAVQPCYAAALADVIERYELMGQQAFLLSVALDFDPEPVSASRFEERWPYTPRDHYAAGLEQLAERGFLTPQAGGQYQVSAQGQEAGRALTGALVNSLRDQLPLPPDQLAQTVALLERLVQASLDAPEPARKPTLTVNRHSDLGPDAPPLLRIIQFVADLNAFRDDVHVSSWRGYGVSGPAWEAFTLLWRGEADSAHTAAIALSDRPLSATDYDRAFQTLTTLQWVEVQRGTPDGYTLTEKGRAVRDEAEAETDRVFFAPWAVLSAAEVDSLGTLLQRLSEQAGDGCLS